MAGSYEHVTTSKGKLRSPETMFGMIENRGDTYEAIEEMYGMIWWLAKEVAYETHQTTADVVEEARQNYRAGLNASPGLQGRKQ